MMFTDSTRLQLTGLAASQLISSQQVDGARAFLMTSHLHTYTLYTESPHSKCSEIYETENIVVTQPTISVVSAKYYARYAVSSCEVDLIILEYYKILIYAFITIFVYIVG